MFMDEELGWEVWWATGPEIEKWEREGKRQGERDREKNMAITLTVPVKTLHPSILLLPPEGSTKR